jgi:predicted TIM-barrel fold metal-dependent hydrolase
MNPLVMVSADGHAAARPDTYLPYLDLRYRDRSEDLWADFIQGMRQSDSDNAATLDVVDPNHAVRTRGRNGGFDLARRMRELDREGVVAEVIHPGTNSGVVPFFTSLNQPYPADVRFAGVRAYHRWLADTMADSGGRLYGVANPGPCYDMDETIDELRWVAEHGFVSVSVPGATGDPGLPSLGDRFFEPFWAACVELGLVLSIHAGHGRLQGHSRAMRREDKALFAPDFTARRAMWQLMLGGVLDRYPTLTVALTETRADWVPETLKLLDHWLPGDAASMELKPSEYWQRNCMAGVSSIHRSEVELRYEIGVERMMFGTDFPHIESTWPNTGDWIFDALGQVPADEARQILGGNAIRCYGLDRAVLEPIAARLVGVTDHLLTGDPVPPALIETFQERAAYLRPAETVEAESLRRVVDEDLAAWRGVAPVR